MKINLTTVSTIIFWTKNFNDFWKSWSKKNGHNNSFQQEIYINGSNDNEVVLNAFKNHFESTYTDSSADNYAKLEFESCSKSALHKEASTSYGSYVPDISCITVELVDRCIRKLGIGKSCGPDKLMSEHLINAHPILVVQLTNLFKCIAFHS